MLTDWPESAKFSTAVPFSLGGAPGSSGPRVPLIQLPGTDDATELRKQRLLISAVFRLFNYTVGEQTAVGFLYNCTSAAF